MDKYPKRKLHRLKEWDYSQNGYYFITICTNNKENLLSTVGNAVLGVPPKMKLTDVGMMVDEAWRKLSVIDSCIKTDEFCIMPNHIHGIIVIDNKEVLKTERRGRRSLHSIVAGFKSVTTRKYNSIASLNKKQSLWQSSFYDTVIRNEKALYEIRKYIIENPFKWIEDKYYR